MGVHLNAYHQSGMNRNTANTLVIADKWVFTVSLNVEWLHFLLLVSLWMYTKIKLKKPTHLTFCLYVFVIKEQEEMLLKQHKGNAGDSLDLSSLTLEEPSSPVEEVVTNISCTKVSLKCIIVATFLCIMYLKVLGSYCVLLGFFTIIIPSTFMWCTWFNLCSPRGVSILSSLCCSTPLHLMMKWRSSQRTQLQSCQRSLKTLCSVCWRSLQRRWWMLLQSLSLMGKPLPVSHSQAVPQPVWCMDPTTISIKVGNSHAIQPFVGFPTNSDEDGFSLAAIMKKLLLEICKENE